MPAANQEGVTNKLLAAMPPREFARLLARLEAVDLSAGDMLHEPGQAVRHVYFPQTCLLSLLAVVEHDMTLEVDLVGPEGMIGVSLVLGNAISPVRAVVQRGGAAIRIEAAHFSEALARSAGLQEVLHQYANTLLTQAMQVAVCSRFHLLEARLARSLLLIRDRLQSNEFHVTHETLAHALGVRRAGVTNAASALQQKHLIGYSRGNIRILDDTGLREASCKCQQVAEQRNR